MTIKERIESYYINGYGFPKKYYTDTNLDNFVKKGTLTQEEADAMKAKKAGNTVEGE